MRRVFLTGGTGCIGSALVPRLLDDQATSVTLLIRAADNADLSARLAKMLHYWGIDEGSDVADGRSRHLRTRIQALRGDITEPRFGLAPRAWDQLAAETTHLIHCAAAVNLLLPLQEARAAAVAPTRCMLALARQGRQGGTLRKLDLVSTVGVWGRTPGAMPERQLPEVTDFHNTYEAAKAEAERVLWSEGDGLPITVHRPSMVVGETGSGRVIHFQVFYHLCEFLSGARTFGIMPGIDSAKLDTVPVDWVASAIDWASRHDATAGRILHLCSGPGAIDMTVLRSAVRAAWQARQRQLPRLRQVDTRILLRLIPLVGLLTGRSGRRALRALPPVLEYLAEQQSFSNTETAATLAGAGLPLPPVGSYLAPVLAYYLDAVAVRAANRQASLAALS